MASIFEDAGFELPAKKKKEEPKAAPESAAPASAAPKNAAPSRSIFEDAGFDLPKSKAAAAAAAAPSGKQFSDEIPIHAPGTPEFDKELKTYGTNKHELADTLENRLSAARAAIDPNTVIPAAARNWWDATKSAFVGANQQYRAGLGEVAHNQPATGIGNAGLGILGMAGAPFAGATNALVEQPVTQLTGNPEIGKSVAMGAGAILPGKATQGARETLSAATQTSARNALVKAIGPENVPAAIERMQSNPRLSPMDVSDPVRVMSQGLIDPAQPAAMDILTGAVRRRQATLPGAVNSAYTEAMGPAPNIPAMLGGLKDRMEDVGKSQIEPALQNAKPVNVTPVLKAIDDEIGADPVGKASLRALKAGEDTYFPLSNYQQRLYQLRQQMTSGVGDPSAPKFLDATGEQGAHKIQAGLRAEAQNLLTSAAGSDRNLGGKLMDMRNKIVDSIDEAAGGQYKPALKAYRDAKQVDEAFDAGFDTLKNRPGRVGLEDRPEMFAEWKKNATPEEVVARRLGTRLDIDRQIHSVKNEALAGQNITAIEYNRDKLRMLFGKDEADRLIKNMDDASAEAQTNAKLIAGSKTAETQAGQRALGVRKPEPFQMKGALASLLPSAAAEIGAQYAGLPPGIAGVGTFALGAGGGGIKKAVQSFQQARDLKRNIEFARMASATGAERERTINLLLGHPQVRALEGAKRFLPPER